MIIEVAFVLANGIAGTLGSDVVEERCGGLLECQLLRFVGAGVFAARQEPEEPLGFFPGKVRRDVTMPTDRHPDALAAKPTADVIGDRSATPPHHEPLQLGVVDGVAVPKIGYRRDRDLAAHADRAYGCVPLVSQDSGKQRHSGKVDLQRNLMDSSFDTIRCTRV
jgi:hypothetical protein